MVATADRDDDVVPHAKQAWEFFRSIGSPKYHVAPMVDQVAPNIHEDANNTLKALDRLRCIEVRKLEPDSAMTLRRNCAGNIYACLHLP